MEYLIHFEDGSSGYLSHHGVKGMKWGVWNAETAARRRGSSKRQFKEGGYSEKEQKKIANKTARQFRKDPTKTVSSNNPFGQAIASHPAVKKAAEAYINSHSEEMRFNNNDKLQKKYLIKAADKAYDYMGGEKSGWTKEKVRNWYMYDDGDQGMDNSFSLYLDDRAKSGKVDINKYLARQEKAWKNYNDAVSTAVDDMVGKHGGKKAKLGIKSKRKGWAERTVKDVLEGSAREHLWEEVHKSKSYGEYSSSKSKIGIY